MKAVVQRVLEAQLRVKGELISQIGPGLLVFLGLEKEDATKDLEYLTRKVLNLRIFSDAAGKMNLSVQDTGGDVLLVSQFTLLGDVRRGNRPGFDRAMPPEEARGLYQRALEGFRSLWPRVFPGVFGGDMKIHALNDGPVTLLIDSRSKESV